MIPNTLAALPNWLVWRSEVRDGKPTKVPYDAKTGHHAKSNTPATWSDLWTAERAMRTRRYSGLGFVFANGGGLFGVDMDGCLRDGELASWAADVLEQFPTYAELSPSGSGVKLFGLGSFPGRGPKKTMPGEPVDDKQPGIEVYCRGRFFAVTGRRWPGAPQQPRNCQLALAGLLATYWPQPAAVLPMHRGPLPGGKEPIDRARRYLARTPGAVSGQRGHDRTFRAACVLVRDIGLSPADAFALLSEWNQTCNPPWSDGELQRKVAEATKATAAAV